MKERDPEKRRKDKEWSDFIKARDKECQWCGGSNRLSADHIFSRKVLATRWNPDNGIALCCGCHLFKKRYEPFEWALVVIDKVGMQKLRELYHMHHKDK